jgi:ribonuclease HI
MWSLISLPITGGKNLATELLLNTNRICQKDEVDTEEARPQERCITIYTDGSCPNGRGAGGYCAVILAPDGTETEVVGGEADTTNNRMELQAAIAVLERYQDGSETTFQIISDSTYLIDGMNKLVRRWEKEGWKNANRKPVENKDLWLRLIDLARGLDIEWVWIKLSDGNPYNELATTRALEQARRMKFARPRDIS